jgi:hypothetical protein
MGASFSSKTTGGTAAATKNQQKKRKEVASPMKLLNQDKEAHGVKYDDNNVPFIPLFERHFDRNVVYFQLRKTERTTSDFTDVARQNLMREHAVAKAGGSTTGSAYDVLEHYTTTASAIKRWEKALAAKASTDGDKTNCAMPASIETKQSCSLPKMKPCPAKENLHPNKLNDVKKLTPLLNKTKTPRKIATWRPASQPPGSRPINDHLYQCSLYYL